MLAVGGAAFLLGHSAHGGRGEAGGPVPASSGAAVAESTAPRPAQAAVEPPTAQDAFWSLRLVDRRGDAVVGAQAIVGGSGSGPPLTARSDGLGLVTFRVPARIADHDPLLVVAGGPGAVAWRPLPTRSGHLGEVRLGQGLAVAGRLRLPDGSPAEGTRLRFRWAALLGDANGRATALLEELLGAERPAAVGEAEVDALGRFRLEGLDPGVYLVESRLPRSEGFERLFLSSHRGSLVDLVDGSQPLELVVDGLLAELVLYDREFRPVPGARFELEGLDAEGTPYRRLLAGLPGEEASSLWLPPSRALTVRALRADLAPVETEVALGDQPAGVVRVELESPGLPGVGLLRPLLVAPNGRSLAFLWTLERRVEGGYQSVAAPARATEPEWIGPLEPGRYRLTVTGQGASHPLLPGVELPFAPIPVEFRLAAGEARRLEVPASRPRRLVVRASASDDPVGEVELVAADVARRLSFVPAGATRRRRAPAPEGLSIGYEPLPLDPCALRLHRRSGRVETLAIPAGEGDHEATLGP